MESLNSMDLNVKCAIIRYMKLVNSNRIGHCVV
jgi:hypothetical protein